MSNTPPGQDHPQKPDPSGEAQHYQSKAEQLDAAVARAAELAPQQAPEHSAADHSGIAAESGDGQVAVGSVTVADTPDSAPESVTVEELFGAGTEPASAEPARPEVNATEPHGASPASKPAAAVPVEQAAAPLTIGEPVAATPLVAQSPTPSAATAQSPTAQSSTVQSATEQAPTSQLPVTQPAEASATAGTVAQQGSATQASGELDSAPIGTPIIQSSVTAEQSIVAEQPVPPGQSIAAEQPAATEVTVPQLTSVPVSQPMYLPTPIPPRDKGNRAFGVLVGLVATIGFAVLYAGAAFLILLLQGTTTPAPRAFLQFLSQPVYWVPALFFFGAFVLLCVIVNRAGWWAYVIFGLIVAVIVYFASIGGALLTVQVWNRTPAEALEFLGARWLDPLAIVAGFLAREVTIWFGAWIARRGRLVAERNRLADEEYDRQLAAAYTITHS